MSTLASRTIAPLPLKVHGALVLTQTIFGAGSIVAAFGLPSFNPLLFAAIREGLAGPLLLLAAWSSGGLRNISLVRHRSLFFLLGACIFGNQACYIVGIKLAGGVAGAMWQPSQPIWTMFFAIVLRRETASRQRAAGIVYAFFGCLGMIAFSSQQTPSSGRRVASATAGHFFFVLNCVASSLYVLISKTAVAKFPSIVVTALSYCCATPMTVAVAIATTALRPAFACSDCSDPWAVPTSALPALVYWVLFQSVAAYFLMTWAGKYAPATVVSAYTVLQPVTATLLSVLLVALGSTLVAPPSTGSIISASFVLLGLYTVVTSADSSGMCAKFLVAFSSDTIVAELRLPLADPTASPAPHS